MSPPSRRATNSVVLTVGVVLLVLGGLALTSMRIIGAAEREVADVEPRYARLLGLRESAVALGEAQAAQAASIDRLAYAAAQSTSQVGNDLQQRVRKLIEGAGMAIVSSQVAPPQPDIEKGYQRVSVSLRLEGDLPALQSALVGMRQQAPAMVVEELAIQSAGQSGPQSSPRLQCRLTVASYHLLS